MFGFRPVYAAFSGPALAQRVPPVIAAPSPVLPAPAAPHAGGPPLLQLLFAAGGAAGVWLGVRIGLREENPWARAGGWFVAADSFILGMPALLSLVWPAVARALPVRISVKGY